MQSWNSALSASFSSIELLLLHIVVKNGNYNKHKLRPIGAATTLPHAYSMNALFMSGGGAADRTVNDITPSVFVSYCDKIYTYKIYTCCIRI